MRQESCTVPLPVYLVPRSGFLNHELSSQHMMFTIACMDSRMCLLLNWSIKKQYISNNHIDGCVWNHSQGHPPNHKSSAYLARSAEALRSLRTSPPLTTGQKAASVNQLWQTQNHGRNSRRLRSCTTRATNHF